ncbi:TRAP transporter large permease [Sulfitobacter sp. W074]|uniref:TRAP transporter large permease n=1 Tax=Sulfitobacter sp. W074 TaxID=2867026 RepID=UPI0021A35361|nr:TRAP transporter large permease [Sulfitobacter sp. W074]UWR38470.1 TRAP transporter large permease [Sulfitobacter sp. W074]
MEPLSLGAIAILVVMFLVTVRVPVAIALFLVAFGGMWMSRGLPFALIQAQLVPFATVSTYTFVVVPMFILMGAIMSSSGVVKELYHFAQLSLARFRGSLYHATVVGSTLFAAISGSTIVNSAMFTKIAMPEMMDRDYNKAFAAGCIAGVGTLAALIPPSLSFIIFGILTGESIGRLLVAGILPGMLTAALFMMAIAVMLRWKPHWAPHIEEIPPLREKLRALRAIWPVMLLILLVLGGIYSGIMPPSGAGAVGVVGAIVIALARRKLSARDFGESVESTLGLTAALFFIIIGGALFSRFLLTSGFIGDVNDFMAANAVTPMVFLGMIIVLYLVLGMFVDPISIMVMTLPFLFPVSQAMGIDPIWFGVVVVKLVEIAVISPPVGMNLFAVVSASEGQVETKDVFAGILPFIVAEVICLVLIFAFPVIATFLSDSMG